MTEVIIRVNEQGKVVIPANLRQELGLVSGSKLIVHLEGRRIVLEQPEDVFRRLRSTFNSPKSLVDELVEERPTEARHE
ncbi:AbrB/MazE/SpoVT family DNA-binding domain-containing protein [Chlorogloea sp. CCALA 695]|uniref:AbrB/MazE/SpoVT family DNA-binding domain-containing protein n=1 Tax=Chlorogloea sp. CCALA 695 TaxID=2107693 RepID=UPI000D05F2BD|nr:AbrB/MazE/SpoVT family DNA-binding domain-containing protein [Chlorogloea sp. CCALA 695]PSB34752.1 AbrB family transcriptional regulator [Chlorogloea sp. CCALA 695]